jgi:hypothetical protein
MEVKLNVCEISGSHGGEYDVQIVFWDILPCKMIVDRRYRGSYCLHHQGLMMEAVYTSETSVNFNVTTIRYIPKDSKLHTRHRENLKSHYKKPPGPYKGDRGNSVSVVSDYGLDDRAIGVRSPAGTTDFSSNLCVQTGSGAHPAPCTMGTGGPFPGPKRGRGVTLTNHPPSSAEVKNE